MTGGFLMAVIAAVVAIVIAVPEYAEPAVGGPPPAPTSVASTPPVESVVTTAGGPESKPPDKLKGYRWPVRGGILATYYDWNKEGQFSIDGKRVHGGIDITWFPGALVKAAHSGTVVAVGRDWIKHVGYEDSVRALLKKGKGKKGGPLGGVVIDDGNGYRSVYTNLKNLAVRKGDKVKAGAVIGAMGTSGGRHFMRYQLVRMDGDWLRVAGAARKAGYPDYAREHVDPLAVLNVNAKTKPNLDKRPPPADPPRLSDY